MWKHKTANHPDVQDSEIELRLIIEKMQVYSYRVFMLLWLGRNAIGETHPR